MDQVDDIDELYRTVLEDLEEIWRQEIEEEKAVYDAWKRVKTRILLESDPVELDGDVDVPGPCEEEVQHPEPPQLAPALHEAEQQQEQEEKDGEATTELTPEKLRWQAKKVLDSLVVSTKGFEITQEQVQQITEHLSAANRVFGQQKIKRPNRKKRLRERKKVLMQNAETNSTASGSGTALAPSNQNQNQSNHSQNPNERHQLVSLLLTQQ
ncbi:hypothetical protein VTN00DRAFT_3272 [Thermoascus crustaceus]|uniref:uncharacterized protein n=1 Tax=Thermoascus crustaceus TaxID=5088 RepID=UPI0037432E06